MAMQNLVCLDVSDFWCCLPSESLAAGYSMFRDSFISTIPFNVHIIPI